MKKVNYNFPFSGECEREKLSKGKGELKLLAFAKRERPTIYNKCKKIYKKNPF